MPPSRSVIGHNVPGAKMHDAMVCYSCGAGQAPPDANGVQSGHVGASCPVEVTKLLGETWPGWLPNGLAKDPSRWDPTMCAITKQCAQEWVAFLACKNITANFDSSGRSPVPDFQAVANQ